MRNFSIPALPLSQNYFRVGFEGTKKRGMFKLLMTVCGFVTGAVNGAFGSGGGMLAVPALSYVGGLSKKQSHATAIAVILPLCVVGSSVYATGGGYDYPIFAPTIIGVTLGGIIGAVALKKISSKALELCFYGLMMLAGLKMLFA